MTPHYRDVFPTREQVREVRCPECGAARTQRCMTHVGVEREGNHTARVQNYKRLKVRAAGA